MSEHNGSNITRNQTEEKATDGGKLPEFVPLYKSTMKTPAWRAMSHGARLLYVALKSRHNTRLQNAVYLSARDAAKELGSKKDYIGKWHRELQHYGFAVLVSPGRKGIGGSKGKAAHFRLTDCWYAGKPPTRDFERWNGAKFDASVPQKGDASVPQKGDSSVPQKGDSSVPQKGDIKRGEPLKGLSVEEREENGAADAAPPLSAALAPPPCGAGGAGPHIKGVQQDTPSREAKQASSRKTSFPVGWEFSMAELDVAQQVCPHWTDDEKIVDEFDKFRDWHLMRGVQLADWDLAWSNWCRRGKDHDAQHPPKELKRRGNKKKKQVQQERSASDSYISKDGELWTGRAMEMMKQAQEAEEAAERQRHPYENWNPDDDRVDDDREKRGWDDPAGVCTSRRSE